MARFAVVLLVALVAICNAEESMTALRRGDSATVPEEDVSTGHRQLLQWGWLLFHRKFPDPLPTRTHPSTYCYRWVFRHMPCADVLTYIPSRCIVFHTQSASILWIVANHSHPLDLPTTSGSESVPVWDASRPPKRTRAHRPPNRPYPPAVAVRPKRPACPRPCGRW